MQTVNEFKASLKAEVPGDKFSAPLKSLWYDGKGDWHLAHAEVDHLSGSEAAWVHAYLHRKEKDIGNADYWYAKAGKDRPAIPLDMEWEQLVTYFLA